MAKLSMNWLLFGEKTTLFYTVVQYH